MSIPVSVVISCAGIGRRLGLSKTKALAHVCGRPIIAWHLDALSWVKDLRIVVGYQAGDVIECVKAIRKDVVFAFNHDYENTGTAASFLSGAFGAKGLVVSLDGDLIVCPHSLRSFIEKSAPSVGILPVTTDEPVNAVLEKGRKTIVAFEKNNIQSSDQYEYYEWSGLCQLTVDQLTQSKNLGFGKRHVYEVVAPHLPLPAMEIDAREIDTAADFERAEQWLKLRSHRWLEERAA